MLREFSGSSNRLSTVEVHDGLFLAVYDEEIIILPDVLQLETVDILHESHLGIESMLRLARGSFTWLIMLLKIARRT